MSETWVVPWVVEKLLTVNGIEAVDAMSSGLLRVTRKQHSPFNIGAMGVEAVVETSNVTPLSRLQNSDRFGAAQDRLI